MRKPKLLIWDYDGTLAPTRDQIVPSFQAAFEHALGYRVSDETVLSWFGPTDEEVIRGHVPPENYPAAIRIFYEHYRHLEATASMFGALRQFLKDTRAASVRHALMTNKGRMTTEIALRAQGLWPTMAMVVTGDDVDKPKPDPMGIVRILARLGVDPTEAVFLGDSPTDVEAAQRAGISVVAVAYGGIHSKEILVKYAPTWVVERPEDIPVWFDSLA